jgi:hypothetical protein
LRDWWDLGILIRDTIERRGEQVGWMVRVVQTRHDDGVGETPTWGVRSDVIA